MCKKKCDLINNKKNYQYTFLDTLFIIEWNLLKILKN